MRFRNSLSLLALSASLGAWAAPATAAAPKLPPLALRNIPTQLPTGVRPLRYRLSITPDAEALRFAGAVTIDIQVQRPVDSITLNAAGLDLRSATLSGVGAARRSTGISADSGAQTATIAFGGRIAPGRYQLGIDYRGTIGRQAAGFFALDYDSAAGRKRALFTQFEASDARRFFPSWDEPQFRTPFELEVTVPAGQDVIGNMPKAGVRQAAAGMKTVSFQPTPPMSSYLLFLGVGEFDRITNRAAGVEIGVVTRRGSGEQGRWALQGASQILPWYNDYFGTPFPLPKLDNVAGPGSSQFFGAMENWGAIFSFESALLDDPSITSEATRQRIFEVAAHEMAHQWFGDLVTMAWWDDIWLNEGFASWMASKAMQNLHPEWEAELDLVNGREAAMRLDSVTTTHPVVQHIATVEQMSQAFDSITYQKGEAVITMLEDYVGADAWRRGVQAYVAAHKYSNAQTDDLWASVEAAAGRPITAIAHDFTTQPGIPLIRVEASRCVAGKTIIDLRQTEFTRDRPDKATLSWRVPVVASTIGGPKVRTLVTGGAGRISVNGCGPVLINSGQAGYYRTLYLAPMIDRLTNVYASLKPVDQLGLLADSWSLGLAGREGLTLPLDMIDAMPANANGRLVSRVATILDQIHDLYEGDEAHQAMVARYASARLGPVLDRIGWTAKPGEASNVAILRGELITTLGAVGDPRVVAEARRLYDAGDPLATQGGLRGTILGVVARNVDAAGWDRLRAQAKAEKNPLVRAQLYRALGSTRDPALAQRALDLALTDEPGATTGSAIVSSVAARNPDLAFDFAVRNRDKVEALVDEAARSRFIPGLAATSADPATIAKLRQYAERYMNAQSRRPADISIASIEDRLRIRNSRLDQATRWFEAHKG